MGWFGDPSAGAAVPKKAIAGVKGASSCWVRGYPRAPGIVRLADDGAHKHLVLWKLHIVHACYNCWPVVVAYRVAYNGAKATLWILPMSMPPSCLVWAP